MEKLKIHSLVAGQTWVDGRCKLCGTFSITGILKSNEAIQFWMCINEDCENFNGESGSKLPIWIRPN